MAEEYTPHKDVKKAHKLLENAKLNTDTKFHEMSTAYTKSAEKHLMKNGKIDYSLLKNEDVQEAMTKDIISHLRESYEKQTGIKLSDIKEEGLEERLLEMNYGIDYTSLKQLFKNYKEDLTASTYINEIVAQNIQQLHQNEIQYAVKGIGREHLDDIVKYTGIEKEPINKTKMSDRALSQLLIQYSSKGKISSEWLEKQSFYEKKKK
jgi:hypothetical protein